MANPLLNTALADHYAGRCVLPVAPHMKAPSHVAVRDMPHLNIKQGESFHIRWKEKYTQERSAEGELHRWFQGASTLMGMGIVCGKVSGCEIDGKTYALEVTECDDAETLEKFERLMAEWGYGALLDRLPKEHTPRLGAHFPYLTPVIEGNQHLARRKIGMNEKGRDDLQVLIETRGEGGFIVVSPTPPGIHPTVPERGYVMERGSWEQLPIVTAEAREQIFACARALNEYFDEEPTDQESEQDRKARVGTYPPDTPLGDYQAHATTESMKVLLERHGYMAVGQIRNGRVYMVRPGKEQKAGHSATLGYAGPGVLHVYSTADRVFQVNKSYSPMYIYTHLEHGGDWKAAQKALAAQGYGQSINGQGHTSAHERQEGPSELSEAADASTNPSVKLPWSDQTNAEQFVAWYGDDMRYCEDWSRWLTWDGKRWRIDNTGQVMRWAKQTIKCLAAQLQNIHQEAEAKAFLAHIKKSLSMHSLEAMVKCAQSEPGIPVTPDAFDRDPWVFNVQNGTIHLRTGELRAHRRDDLLMKISPVPYIADATCPLWKKTLEEVYAKDDELILFDQKATGYTLTGETREQALFICHGSGNNGKSTKLSIMREIMGEGEYALRTNLKAFTEATSQHQPASVEYYIAKLHNVRFAYASEGEDGARLSESLVKDVTGGVDHITGRHPYGQPFSFRPRFKLWLGTNHEPVIRGTDPAIWRRPRKIPFIVSFEGREDKELFNKLCQELPGILVWAVTGCLLWQTNGLEPPKAVKDATAAYRAAMDVVGRFLDECCILADYAKIESTMLYQAYLKWCANNGEQSLSQRRLADQLKERGLRNDTRSNTGRTMWTGIGLSGELF